MEFYQTQMGRTFFERQVPQLIDAVNALAAALSKPAPAAVLPVAADSNFLRDLFFGDYEPEIYKVSPELQRFNRAALPGRWTRLIHLWWQHFQRTVWHSWRNTKLRCQNAISL